MKITLKKDRSIDEVTLKNGSIYKVSKRLGKGNFGSVYLMKLIKSKGNHPPLFIAVKVQKIPPKQQSDSLYNQYVENAITENQLTAENSMLKGAVNEVHVDEQNRIIYSAMPSFGDQDLMDYVLSEAFQTAPASKRMEIMAELFYQLSEAHNRTFTEPVIHMDLKLENIVINTDTGNVTIIDWGLFTNFSVKRMGGNKFVKSGLKGTSHYVSPEVLRKRIASNKSDIWSMAFVCMAISGDVNSLRKIINMNTLMAKAPGLKPLRGKINPKNFYFLDEHNLSNHEYYQNIQDIFRQSLQLFIYKMADKNIRTRPDSLDTERFFRCMARVAKGYEIIMNKPQNINDLMKLMDIKITSKDAFKSSMINIAGLGELNTDDLDEGTILAAYLTQYEKDLRVDLL
jgi:serine/threonine protein kinase